MAQLQEVKALLGSWPATQVPLALLPVRLETRFVVRSIGQAGELRIRIYPDDVHMDTHEPGLTSDEEIWGRHYWEQWWQADAAADLKKAAWVQLVERFDPARAAWIRRALTPLNVARPSEAAPQFPPATQRADTWTQAPIIRGLPDRWVVCGYRAGNRVLLECGRPIQEPLYAGPTPGGEAPADRDDETLSVDEGMRWLVDFDVAERVGMAIRVPLVWAEIERGYDTLVVLGVKAALDSTAGAAQLAALLEAQHYTDGLAFVPQDTPTNNTPDAASGYRSRDPGQETSHQVECGQELCQAGDGSNGDVTARALGLPAAVFSHILHAQETEDRDAQHIHTALWSATWGYFLEQMLDGALPGRFAVSQGRRHFITSVRARGPLPALRVGRQPYGLLPIFALERWAPPQTDSLEFYVEAGVVPLLRAIRPYWQQALPRVPRLTGSVAPLSVQAAQETLIRSLGMEAVSQDYTARPLMESLFFGMPGVTGFTPAVPDAMTARWRQARALLRQLGVQTDPRLLTILLAGHAFPLHAPLVQAGPLSTTETVHPDYIQALCRASYEQVRGETYTELPDGALAAVPTSLLYLLLRHATLLEYASAAFRILSGAGTVSASHLREPAIVDPDIFTSEGMPLSHHLQATVPSLDAAPLRTCLHRLSAANHPVLADLDEFRRSLDYLRGVPTARLDRLLREALDLGAHRLDAWITSFATQRLARLRMRNPTGLFLGGYGWVEQLRPNLSREPTEIPAGEAGTPLQVDTANHGYLHAPSLTHAATAAILRSGYLAQPDANHPLAVDLSSRRVRLAQWLLDGVRQGQPLAALLGYRFERDLQERGGARHLQALRRFAPLGETLKARAELEHWEGEVQRYTGTSLFHLLQQAQAEAQAARQRYEALLHRHRQRFLLPDTADLAAMEVVDVANVVDGLALHRLWKRNVIPFGTRGLPAAGTPDHGTILEALRHLDDAVDAVADVVTAESLYHAVRGNPLRAGATLDAVATGETPPPELEVVRTPRSGTGLTHRLFVLCSGTAAATPAWPTDQQQARAGAEPHLNAWAARLLGDPSKLRLRVEYLDPTTNEVLAAHERRGHTFNVSPLDCLYAMRDESDVEGSELVQRFTYTLLRSRPAGLPSNARLRFVPDRGADWATDDLSLVEFLELVRTASEVVHHARVVAPPDLALPETATTAALDVAELQGRADAAAQAMTAAHTALEALLAQPETATLEAWREALLRLAAFGLPGAVPLSAAGEPADREILLTQAQTVAREAARRRDRLVALDIAFDRVQATPAAQHQHDSARLRVIFGEDFQVLPRFTLQQAEALQQSFAASTALQGGDPLAVVTWLQRVARVREGAARLEALLSYTEALETGTTQTCVVGQLPYQADDRWLALPLPAGQTPRAGRLSLVVHSLTPLQAGEPLAGLVVDEWTEVIPHQSEHTGLAFHYDAPNARPPQAVLLAVPPTEYQPTWDLETLEATVLEALDLARLRAVDPEALAGVPGVEHFLPALCFALNLSGDTISTDFTRAAVV